MASGSRAQNLINTNPGLSQLTIPAQGLMQMRFLCWGGKHWGPNRARYHMCIKHRRNTAEGGRILAKEPG